MARADPAAALASAAAHGEVLRVLLGNVLRNPLPVVGGFQVVERIIRPLTNAPETPDGPIGEIRLLRDGQVIRRVVGSSLRITTEEAGIYRVEVYRRYCGRRVGWIFASPIYAL